MKKILNVAGVTVFASVVAVGAVFADTTGILLPISDGFYGAWRASAEGPHYQTVDDAVCNGTADYVATVVAGVRDSYGVSIASIPDGATITNIEIIPCASRARSGVGEPPVLNVFYRWGGVDSGDAGNYFLVGTTPVDLMTTVFSNLSLFKTSSSTLEAGIVLASGKKGARVSRVAVRVTYTPPPMQPPVAPSDLRLYPATTTPRGILASWRDNSNNESGFSIERGTSSSAFIRVATTSPNTMLYFDQYQIVSGTTYYYRVNAFNAGGSSAYSNVASTTAF